MRKHNQRETTYVRRQEKGRASSINGKRQRWEGRVGNIEETKERGLDRPAVGEYRYRRDMAEIGRGA